MKKEIFYNKIFPICLLLFIIKWFFFFNSKSEIDLLTKFLFDIEDWQYFTYIYNLSNLDFNPSYDPKLTELKFLSLPIYSIAYHSIFFKIFDIYGFIIIEFFIILLFFKIFFEFFNELGIYKTESILLTLFIFCTPNLIDFLQLNQIPYVRVLDDLYNLRIPRPSISHLYFFSFLLILIFYKKKENFKTSHLILIGFLFSLMWGSFYYNLVISGITFIFYYLYLVYSSDQRFTKYLQDIFLVLISFILFSLPILFMVLNTEPDWLIRVGLVEIDISKKKILLSHFIKQITSIKYLIIFVLITLLYFFLKSKKIYKVEGLNLIYLIFFGSTLAPLVFIIISPSISEGYHFANMLVSLSYFILLVFSSLIIFFYLRNLSICKNLIKISIILLLFLYAFSNYSSVHKKNLNDDKTYFSQLITAIKKINIDTNTEILTFDSRLQAHLILNNHTNLTKTISIFTSVNDKQIEKKLISIFKFLRLNEYDFYNFIKNEKHGWRYINNNIAETFYIKYQANTLTTYKDSLDFTSDELKYIQNSSPLHTQQLILPAFEIKRLIDKFTIFNKVEKISPELIVINSNDIFTNNIVLDNSIYCSKTINKRYMIYFIKKDNLNC